MAWFQERGMTSSPNVSLKGDLMPRVIFGDRIVRPVIVRFARACWDSTRPKAAPAPHDPENSLNPIHDDRTASLTPSTRCRGVRNRAVIDGHK